MNKANRQLLTVTLLISILGWIVPNNVLASPRNSLIIENSISANNTIAPRDVVLVIDTSIYMAFETEDSDPLFANSTDDPTICNVNNTCQPFASAKSSIASFLDHLSFPNDRVGIVATTSQSPGGTRNAVVVLPLSEDKSTIQLAINNLKVFQPPICPTGNLICIDYTGHGGSFLGYDCFNSDFIQSGNPAGCTGQDIGTPLLLADGLFSQEDTKKIIIQLAVSPANASAGDASHPNGFCPSSTWFTAPLCRDWFAVTRHPAGDPNYDADDYARDMADLVKNPLTGSGARVYTIGLGEMIRGFPYGEAEAGEKLLQYIALSAGGGNANHGLYYYVPTTDNLAGVYASIASDTVCSPSILVTNSLDTGAGSLRQALTDVCQNGTITFGSSLSGETIHLLSTLIFDKHITIDASPLSQKVILSGDSDNDGDGDILIASISNGQNVTIKSLEFQKGYTASSTSAGAIENLGILNLQNNSFTSNIGNQGGAIRNSGTLYINNTDFTSNSAIEGGAILNNLNATAEITNSIFSTNTAKLINGLGGSAGAIANLGKLTVINGEFLNNHADAGGGAVVNSFGGTGSLADSTFSKNSTYMDGGAVNNFEGSMFISNCTFTENTISGGYNTSGGAVFNKDQMEITGSTFKWNSSMNYGGALVNKNTLHISTSSFIDNNASYGGAASNYGTLTIEQSTFSGNEATPVYGFAGGILNDGNGILTITNSAISSNSAPYGGGIFNLGTDSVVSITGSTVSGNAASGYGGGLDNFGTMTIVHSIISNNSAATGGGVFNTRALIVNNATFNNNSTTNASTNAIGGGAIMNAGSASISNSNFIENSSLFDGGAIVSMSGNLSINNGSFVDNSASKMGGAVSIYQGDADINQSSFSENSAEAGGAIAQGEEGYQHSSSLAISQTIITNNQSDYAGGILHYSGTMTIDQTTLDNNAAQIVGGLAATSSQALMITNSTISGNSTGSNDPQGNHPGGLMLGSPTEISNSTIVNNLGYNGIHIRANTTITNSTIAENLGPGIYHYSGTLNLKNNILANNSLDCKKDTNGVFGAVINNIIEINDCGISAASTDPQLIPLTANGGLTKTMALHPGSSAINAGDIGTCTATDQRGISRFPGSQCDIGAYEYNTTPIVTAILTNGANPSSEDEVKFKVTFSEPVTGVNEVDFIIHKSGKIIGEKITTINASGNSYIVTVSTGSGNGTLRLILNDDDSIVNAANLPLNGSGVGNGDFIIGQEYIINKINLPPTDISLSNSSLPENKKSAWVIGKFTTIDTNVGDLYIYKLVDGIGSEDNSFFILDGDLLKAAHSFDHETKDLYTIRLRATDGFGESIEKVFEIRILDENEPAANITLTSTIIFENQPSGTVVGRISSNDPDENSQIPHYEVFDNAAEYAGSRYFYIDGDQLKIRHPLYYPITSSYSIIIYATDETGMISSKAFTISVINTPPIFADVGDIHWAVSYIERLANAGITNGCDNENYCPNAEVTRAQMAVFLVKGITGLIITPDFAPTFTDTAGHWAEDWIEALKNDGITSGCAAGLYCPDNSVTRAQMAVFLLKSTHGASYSPPPATGTFSDVSTDYWAAAWIEQLAAEGITSGCGSGVYCPESPVTRAQMAVFLVKAFVLP